MSEIANALGVERLSVLGVSGGGPYSAACAYAIGDRLVAERSDRPYRRFLLGIGTPARRRVAGWRNRQYNAEVAGSKPGMTTEEREELESTLARLRVTLAERTASIPVHSIRPHQLIQIEELEDEIAALQRALESPPPPDDGSGHGT